MNRSCSTKKTMKMINNEDDLVPLVSSFNDKIRPLLDAVDRLRHLNVMQEGINLPTIVVVGDQSSGKSSVLESLAGISLPRGQGICTRVPLVMRLQNDPTKVIPELLLEYCGKSVMTTEQSITDAIVAATDEIAGSGKGISNVPLTLVVKKKGVPDLTMVDLPGITRVPVHGQPEDIYDQIHAIIMEYISPKESIVLNVLSATVDFPTCESIRMSQQVDRTGERTLAVVTKSDRSPEGLLEKVTADDVNIGLGYVCVRNRINDETYDEARNQESILFKSHPLLSMIDKSIVGVPVLAQKLVDIQASSIARCLPDIIKQINKKLTSNISELHQMPQNLTSVSDATRVVMNVLGRAKESLRKILIREISILEESKGITLPNFISRSAFLTILQKKIKKIEHTPPEFICKLWSYIENIVRRVVKSNCEDYPQIQICTAKALDVLIDTLREKSLQHVREMVDMEKTADYTTNPDYTKTFASLISEQEEFMASLGNHSEASRDHLRNQNSVIVKQAFYMRMQLSAYWKSVILRLVDGVALYLLYSVKNLVEAQLEKFILDELIGRSGIEKMLHETPATARKRDRLKHKVKLLKDSNAVVVNLMDRLIINGD
ncbi:Dynamin-related protein 4C [Zostera marina]|uniref:Dynamin-related protein 4C n=1 Tax=Zostera marina TaxID=29655 RepID=A0A0K9PH61_ZOSMR|nr:Dynamin-related protein 4C [Zostera marina]